MKKLVDTVEAYPIEYFFHAHKDDDKVKRYIAALSSIVPEQVDEFGVCVFGPTEKLAIKCLTDKFPKLDHLNQSVWREEPTLFMAFAKERVDAFFRTADKAYLSLLLCEDLVAYFSTIYNFATGVGALKEWLLRENLAVDHALALRVEALLDTLNYISHGDMVKETHNVTVSTVLKEVLSCGLYKLLDDVESH
jgi:hypothetical protein